MHPAFLDDWARRLRPFPVSQSSLIDLCVRIVRRLYAKGDISLTPEALRTLLEITFPEGVFRQRPLDVALSGKAPLLPAEKPKK